jgi:hypothetical protein
MNLNELYNYQIKMNNMNFDIDNLDDYINTFKLKNFEDSDDDEVMIDVFRIQDKNIGSDFNINKQGENLNLENANLIEKEKIDIVGSKNEKEKLVETKSYPNITEQVQDISNLDKVKDHFEIKKEIFQVQKAQEVNFNLI